MGQSKGGGYKKKSTVTAEQKQLLDQLLSQAGNNNQQAAAGFQQFLPGGGGGEPIKQAAMNNFQQSTIPAILNAFGDNAKSSSGLNQALAAGAANLNTDLGSQLAQLQLSASSGLGNLGTSQANIGSSTPQFAYMQRAQPFWQQALLSGIGAGGALGAGQIGAGRKAFGLF